MTQAEFMELHEDCVTAMRAYFVEAEVTSGMLSECTPDPMPFETRLRLLAQEINESDAHKNYVGAKIHLHSAALHGYDSSN
jgi:hypothetical protein